MEIIQNLTARHTLNYFFRNQMHKYNKDDEIFKKNKNKNQTNIW